MSKIEITRIIRSKRRSIAFIISHDATLVVRAPMRTPLPYIEKLVQSKADWIERKKHEAQKRPQAVEKSFSDGEVFLYLGKKYQLTVTKDLKISLGVEGQLFFPKIFLWRAKARLLDWYHIQAKIEITKRTEEIAKRLNLKHQSIRITNAQGNWGSCGPKNSLNFNWRLIMAPEEVMEYVIVHELMHILEKNHSAKFWDKVQALIPDYKKKRKWLRENGLLLMV